LPGKINSNFGKKWNWFIDTSLPDYAKSIVDKYDFDGDGRLNAREFIIAMIRNNKKVVDSLNKCLNCMETVVEKKIDPMYLYVDCGSTGTITSEQLWTSMHNLKRPVQTKYNIYNCSLESGQYRTTSMNDFVLKSKVTLDGKLTKEEFRLGVLQGYWERHVRNTGVVLDDSHNMKSLRWASDGDIDQVCDRIKAEKAKMKGF